MMVQIDSESIAYWYLRLNGFLIISNFVVHPDQGRNQETDADILGVRFPYRAENLVNPMKDEPALSGEPGKPHILIVEVKSGRCNLNGPWTKPERNNMLRVLKAIGTFQSIESQVAANELYQRGCYSGKHYRISLVCIGREVNTDVSTRYADVPQIVWPQVLSFVYRRFAEYRKQKSSHQQWDETGHTLWDLFEQSKDENRFIQNIDQRIAVTAQQDAAGDAQKAARP